MPRAMGSSHVHVYSTPSGNLHGMPVSFLLGINTQPEPGNINATGFADAMKEYDWIKPQLTTSRIVYIGLRDVDSGEKQILRQHGIKAFSMHEGIVTIPPTLRIHEPLSS